MVQLGKLSCTLLQMLINGNIYYIQDVLVSHYKYICGIPETNYTDQRAKTFHIQIGTEWLKLILSLLMIIPLPSITGYTYQIDTYIHTHTHIDRYTLMDVLKTKFLTKRKSWIWDHGKAETLKSGFSCSEPVLRPFLGSI